jgi:predicted secreted protein
MKASLIAFSCILIGAVACTAPQGKKISANGATNGAANGATKGTATGATGGLAAVAEGPGDESTTETSPPAAQEAAVTEADKGKTVSVANQGKLTVTLDAAQSAGYSWRLAETPDPTVLKLVSEDYLPPTSGAGRGQKKWVFQAVGPGDVKVKMWYGNLRESSLGGRPSFDFVASVSGQGKPTEKKSTTTTTKTVKKA